MVPIKSLDDARHIDNSTASTRVWHWFWSTNPLWFERPHLTTGAVGATNQPGVQGGYARNVDKSFERKRAEKSESGLNGAAVEVWALPAPDQSLKPAYDSMGATPLGALRCTDR